MNPESLRVLAVRPGERVLDLGCGLGQLTHGMARAAGSAGRVVGIDRSAEQLAAAQAWPAEAGAAPVDFRQGDVLALELDESEWGWFDLAHARFVLEHVPRPLDVVRAMVRAVRGGGRVAIADDDHDVFRLWPEPAGFDRLWRAYTESYLRRGNDPYVGRKLYSMLHEAGARPTRLAPVWLGTSAGEPSFGPWVENLEGVVAGARDEILSTGVLDAPAFDEAMAAIRAWGRRDDAAAWYSMSFAEGMKD